QDLRTQSLKGGANEQMPLDLGDPLQHRFVVNRLKASGLTPLTAPRLFTRLEALRREAGLPVRPTTGATAESTSAAWCGHIIPLGGTGGDALQAHFQGTGLTSCYNGSDYAYVDINAFATDKAQTRFELLASESYEEYAGKVLETAPLAVALTREPGKQLFVDSVAMAFNELTGQEHLTYTSVTASLHGGAASGDIVLEHPREVLDEVPWDKSIRVCLERGEVHGFLDCDYGSVRIWPDGRWQPFPGAGAMGVAAVDAEASKASTKNSDTPTWYPDKSAYWTPRDGKPYDVSRFQIPARGTYRPHVLPECTVQKVSSKVVAVLMESGGWCEVGSSDGTIVGRGELPWKQTSPGARAEYPFDGLMDFGTGNCLGHLQNVRLEMWVYAEGTCPDPYGGKEPEPFRCPSKKEVLRVDYKRACLAEGTQVARADGQPVSVEQVKVGDKLLANGKGVALTVTSVLRGGELKPLVKLRDERGGEVRVTQTHPMVTATRGVVQAGDLKVGEALLTRTGAARLVGVERIPYEGFVYNFALGTPEELGKVGPEATTLYANGFLVGDSQMQTELDKRKRVDTRDVLARLHGTWHEDYRRQRTRQPRR
ncbi:MAG TPA: Hint domain-containing protein, partial [Myxococcus sp.]|nr:Hint domain-containing protein [Myxococcus sp.]